MKVSAIMPARGRAELAAKTVECFFNQSYPDKELLIYDDDDCPAFRTGVKSPTYPDDRIWHFWHSCVSAKKEALSIAAKRNWLCARVPEENLIMHWDSDDWYSRDRMEHQVEMFRSSGKAVVGYHNLLFFDEDKKQGWKYWSHPNFFAVGTSLAFSPSWWKNNPFPLTRIVGTSTVPLLVGEDNVFVSAARRQRELFTVDGENHIVARIHSENTCKKDLNGCSFRAVPNAKFPKEFFQ
jgi:hypothetical protein